MNVQRGSQEERLSRQLAELRGDATLGVAGKLARMHAPWLHRAVAVLHELDGVEVRWPTSEQRLPWTDLSDPAGLEGDFPAVAVATRDARAQAWREAGRDQVHEDAEAEAMLSPRALALLQPWHFVARCAPHPPCALSEIYVMPGAHHGARGLGDAYHVEAEALALYLRRIGEDLEVRDVGLLVGVVDFPFAVQPGEACELLQRTACDPAGTLRLSETPSVWLQRVEVPFDEQVALLCRALGVEGFVPRALAIAQRVATALGSRR